MMGRSYYEKLISVSPVRYWRKEQEKQAFINGRSAGKSFFEIHRTEEELDKLFQKMLDNIISR